MADIFELAYVYSRICGSVRNAVIGDRAIKLARLKKLQELWTAIFKVPPPAVPESILVKAAEKEAIKKSVFAFRKLINSFDKHEPFFEAMLRKTAFSRVKFLLSCIRNNIIKTPEIYDSEIESEINYSAYPDPVNMFKEGRFSWIDKEASNNLFVVENKLDLQYFTELWESLQTVPKKKLGLLPDLISMEFELENLIWAIRLKKYYNMNEKDIRSLLINIKNKDVISSALTAISFRLDYRTDWNGWKWEKLIPESNVDLSIWTLDVRGMEAAARRYLHTKIKTALHLSPFSYTPLYCFFKIKEYETAMILGLFEGVYLGAPFEEIAAFTFAVAGA